MADTIDARSGTQPAYYESSLVRDALRRTPFQAWLLLSLLGVAVLFYLKQTWSAKQAEQRERLMYRRRAGIPDSDKRDFKVAYLDAEQLRLKGRNSAKTESSRSLPHSQSSIGDSFYKVGRMSNSQSANNLSYSRQSSAQPSRRQSVAPTSNSNNRDYGAMLPPPAPSPRQQFSPQPFSPSRLSQALSFPTQETQKSPRKRSHPPSTVGNDESKPKHDEKRLRPTTRSMASSVSPRPETRAVSPPKTTNRKRKGSPTESATIVSTQNKPKRKKQRQEVEETAEEMDVDAPSVKRKSTLSVIPGGFDSAESSDSNEETQSDAKAQKTSKRRRQEDDNEQSEKAPRKIRKGESSSRPKTRPSSGKKAGDQWQNLNGETFRINDKGVEEKLVLVKEMRPKYKMPKDSTHPDSKITEEAIVEKWVAEDAFESLREAGKLAWQPESNVEEMQVDSSSSPNRNTSISTKQYDTDESDIYFVRGARTPLRTASPKPSPKSSQGPVILPNGRIRLPNSASNRALTPKRSLVSLLQDRNSNTKRKKASIASMDSSFWDTPDTSSVVVQGDESVAAATNNADTTSNGTSFLPILPTASAPVVTSAPLIAPKVEQAKEQVIKSESPSSSTFTLGNAQPKVETALAKAEPSATPAAFSFGPAKTASESTPSFGSAPINPSPVNAAPFSFATNDIPKSEVKKSPAMFSFGAPSTAKSEKDTAKETAPAAASPFSFGNQPSTESKPVSTPAPAFSFGSTTVSAQPSPFPASTSASPFSFGNSTTAAPSKVPETKPAAQSFSFGSNQTASVPSSGFGNNASSGFGNAASTGFGNVASPAAPSSTPSPFSFGNATTSPQKTTTAPAFGFPPQTTTEPVNNASTFSFGQSAAPAPPSGFSFGVSSPTASPGLAPPVFGAVPSLPTTPTTPGRRVARGLPTRRRP